MALYKHTASCPAYSRNPKASQECKLPNAHGLFDVAFGEMKGPSNRDEDCNISEKDNPIKILR